MPWILLDLIAQQGDLTHACGGIFVCATHGIPPFTVSLNATRNADAGPTTAPAYRGLARNGNHPWHPARWTNRIPANLHHIVRTQAYRKTLLVIHELSKSERAVAPIAARLSKRQSAQHRKNHHIKGRPSGGGRSKDSLSIFPLPFRQWTPPSTFAHARPHKSKPHGHISCCGASYSGDAVAISYSLDQRINF